MMGAHIIDLEEMGGPASVGGREHDDRTVVADPYQRNLAVSPVVALSQGPIRAGRVGRDVVAVPVDQPESEDTVVERDGAVEVGHADPEMRDTGRLRGAFTA